MKKTAFTLSELMIALTVLGILCATVLPAIIKTMPNQNKVMMKRVYYNTSNIVSDMINDPDLYPMYNSSGVETKGFDNTDEVTYNGEKYGGELSNDGKGGFAKFIGLFAAHLNTDGDIGTTCPSSVLDGSTINSGAWKFCRTFTTPDGVMWELRSTQTGGTTFKFTTSIAVDVNGDKKPNCIQGDSSDACKNRTENFDRFSMIIHDDGEIEIPAVQTWAREAVQVSSSLTD